jgi:hypothetical protein
MPRRRPGPDAPPSRPATPALLALTLAALAIAAPRAVRAQGAQLPPSVEMYVPKPPTLAAGDGARFLAYELHLTNFTPGRLTLRRVEVVSADGDARVLLTLSDSALARALSRPGVSPAPALADRPHIGGGLRAVTFLWVPIDAGSLPRAVRHRLTLARGATDTATAEVLDGPAVTVTSDAALIGPPLRGGDWLAANGPSNDGGHRRALIAVDGNASIAQRFGIDWLVVDDSGRSFVGDRLRNESY